LIVHERDDARLLETRQARARGGNFTFLPSSSDPYVRNNQHTHTHNQTHPRVLFGESIDRAFVRSFIRSRSSSRKSAARVENHTFARLSVIPQQAPRVGTVRPRARAVDRLFRAPRLRDARARVHTRRPRRDVSFVPSHPCVCLCARRSRGGTPVRRAARPDRRSDASSPARTRATTIERRPRRRRRRPG